MRVIFIASILLCINFNMCKALGFNCLFSMVYYVHVGEVYSCGATLLHDENIETVTSVFGAHQSGKGHTDVVGIQIYRQDLEFFPLNMEAFFPNIKAIAYISNSIFSINNTHLAPFPNLEYFSLLGNRITSLDSNLFYGLQSIRYISMQENNIKHVGHDFILPDSAEILFYSNPCISMGAADPDRIVALRFELLRNCPPTISQIEDTLESRNNLLTNLDAKVQNLRNEVTGMKYANSQLEERVAFLEGIIEGLRTIVEGKDEVKLEDVIKVEN